MSQIFSLVLLIFVALVEAEEKPDICNGKLKIPDVNQHEHVFTSNRTNLESELNVFKEDLVSVTGDCCFSIHSESQGGGEFQSFQSEGEHRLEITVVNSVYVVECTSGMHPFLKFFLIAAGTIVVLWILWCQGKSYLCRSRL